MKYSINKTLLLESAFSDEISDHLSREPQVAPGYHDAHDTSIINHQEVQAAHQNANRLRHEFPVSREIDRAHQNAYQGVPNIGQNFLNKFNNIASRFR